MKNNLDSVSKSTMKAMFCSFMLHLALATGCTDYLSEVPDNRTTIDSKEKIAQLLVNAYTNAQYAEFAEAMSDNVGDKGPAREANEITEKAYKWEDIEITSQDTPAYYWQQSYSAIAHANQALASIEALGGGEGLNSSKGEALVARAYAFFMLVNLFSSRYDPATAEATLGIPLLTAPEKNALPSYKRATIAQVYEQIESDLTEGLPLLSDQYEAPQYRFTPAAANAFATRFYLYKGEWEEVVKHADLVIGGADPAVLIKDFTTDEYGALSETEKELKYASTSERSNLLVNWVLSNYRRSYFGNRYGFSKEKNSSLFSRNSNPFRKVWAHNLLIYNTPDLLNNKMAKYHEFFRVTNPRILSGNSYNGIVHFTVEEVLLNRAEAYAMLGEWEKSMEDITYLLSKRTGGTFTNPITRQSIRIRFDPSQDELNLNLMRRLYRRAPNEYTPFYSLSFDQAVFVKGIAELRRREFFSEGIRWFDIKRFNLVVEHPVYEAETLVLEKNDPRRAVQIPASAQALGIKPNPR